MNMDNVIGQLTDEELAQLWRETDWESAGENLAQMQRDIAFAAIKRDAGAVTAAQKKLVRSLDAKLLAVRHVCDSVAQAGIDGIRWDSEADKMRAAFALDSKDYAAKPMRLLIIRPKGHTKTRYIQIPTFYDRAMQTLYAYSLDPVSESTGERKSFAFRKGRSLYDVHAFIVKSLETDKPPKWLIKADVKACYASISHKWLLDNIPMDSHVLNQFLKSGHVFAGELFPPDDFGISLGSSLSPILGNMTLDGAQQAIFDGLHGKGSDIDYADGDLIRFADDILITARTKARAEKIMGLLRAFLSERGLALSEEKTRIIDIEEGFDFLSRSYSHINGRLHSKPSEAAVAKFEQELRELIAPYHGGQKQLIDKLNKKLGGWAAYHKVTDATADFKHIDNLVTTLLLELCEKLNQRTPRDKIVSKYFYREPNGEYVYTLVDKPDVRVRRISDTILVAHKPVSVKKHPYLDADYYEHRHNERAIMAVTGKYKPIWTRQGGMCFYCGKPILTDDLKSLVTVDPSLRETLKNLAYVHTYCCQGKAELYDSDRDIVTRFDLNELLMKMNNPSKKKVRHWHKFIPLTEYFRRCSEPVFTLTFADIEKIIGQPLYNSALKHENYWYMRGERRISASWRSNGYKIRTLNIKSKRLVFERIEQLGVAVDIPEIFLSGRIPPDAKVEMELLIDYIRKKYGI